MGEGSDIFKLLGFIQDDLRKTQTRLVEVRALLAAQNLSDPPRFPCPECGVERGNADALRDHLVLLHGKERIYV